MATSLQNSINNTLATTSLTGTLQAAQMPALTGDVTNSSGSLSTTIANNAVTTAKINAAAVTYAKIQDVAANRLLGNPTGSAAAPSEIALGTGLSFSSNTLVGSYVPNVTTVVTGTSATAAVNNCYVSNNAALCTITLPTTAAVGDEVEIVGLGAGGWALAQNASQLIHFGNVVSATGTGGKIESTHAKDCIKVKCVVANTTWIVTHAIGNLNVTTS